MSFSSLFKRKQHKIKSDNNTSTASVKNSDRGMLVFENTSEVIKAENLLKKEGWHVQVKGPPLKSETAVILLLRFR